MARRAGIAKSTLSQLESGAANPSVETLWSLGVALNVPFAQLVEPVTPPVRVIRAGEGDVVRSDQAHFTGTLLASGPPGTRRDIYVIRMEPGAVRVAEPHLVGSVEHVIVGHGAVRVGPVDALIDLSAGDYATFPGDAPHSYEALTPDTWLTLIMEHR
ncbi:helix-turn-helix domain-containing protein [Luedemannella flava]